MENSILRPRMNRRVRFKYKRCFELQFSSNEQIPAKLNLPRFQSKGLPEPLSRSCMLMHALFSGKYISRDVRGIYTLSFYCFESATKRMSQKSFGSSLSGALVVRILPHDKT